MGRWCGASSPCQHAACQPPAAFNMRRVHRGETMALDNAARQSMIQLIRIAKVEREELQSFGESPCVHAYQAATNHAELPGWNSAASKGGEPA